MAKTDLTAEAREGWGAAKGGFAGPCPYIQTSSAWQAWHVGVHLARQGFGEPFDVRAGRGNLMWANGWQWRVARKLQPISAADLEATRNAVRQLRRIRDDLKRLGAVRAVEKVRAAIRSAGGAVRHAERRRNANSLWIS